MSLHASDALEAPLKCFSVSGSIPPLFELSKSIKALFYLPKDAVV